MSEANGKKSDGRSGEVMKRMGNGNAIKSGIFSKNPLIALKCHVCPVAQLCEHYKPGESCYYEVNEKPDLESAKGILDVLRQKVEIDHVRYQRAVRAQSAFGSTQLDRDTTSLSSALTKDLQVLAQMSIQFGVIEPTRDDPTAPVHLHTHITAENVNLLSVTKEELDDVKRLQAQLEDVKNKLAVAKAEETVIDITPARKQ